MRRLSARRSHHVEDLLYVASGLGLGFVAGFLFRGLVGELDRGRVAHVVAGLTGQQPARATARQAATRIEQALAADPALQGLEFGVLPVRAGHVELHGWAPSRAVGARAVRVAAAAAGDTEVTNRLRVRGEDDVPLTVSVEERRPA
jgi:osmotically-inducible protein OsmY